MASGFDERRRGFEAKWANDEAVRFKVMARRNKLLGLWAAGALGLGGAEAEAYARGVIAADMEEAGEEDVFRKLHADLAGRADEAAIRAKMAALLDEAADQVLNEGA